MISDVAVHEFAAGGDGIDHVDDGVEGLVLDIDVRDGVLSRRRVGRQHDGDHVTDVAGLVSGQGRERRHDGVVGHRPDAGDTRIEITEGGTT